MSRIGAVERFVAERKVRHDVAFDGGLFADSYACVGAVENVIPVDLRIRGCPPTPVQLLQGLLALLDRQ